jgi:hypothetical protein
MRIKEDFMMDHKMRERRIKELEKRIVVMETQLKPLYEDRWKEEHETITKKEEEKHEVNNV